MLIFIQKLTNLEVYNRWIRRRSFRAAPALPMTSVPSLLYFFAFYIFICIFVQCSRADPFFSLGLSEKKLAELYSVLDASFCSGDGLGLVPILGT